MSAIYLDHNATTPLDRMVLQRMQQCLETTAGNPSSIHAAGQRARRTVDGARQAVATLLGCRSSEIIFTSGGTEANNLALFGVMEALAHRGKRHLVVSCLEHASVLQVCERLAVSGYEVSYVPVDRGGTIAPQQVAACCRGDTALVSVMLANNEIGTIQDVAAVARLVRPLGIVVHSDAVQALGKMAVDVEQLGVDLLSCSGHKIYGPQGCGALYARAGTPLVARLWGGHQERSLRPGTENVVAIAGFGQACALAKERWVADDEQVASLRDHFESRVLSDIAGTWLNGAGAPRLSNTTHIGFAGLDATALLVQLDLCGIAVASGAACASHSEHPSHVLLALGLKEAEARSCLRFSLGRGTTAAQLEVVLQQLAQAVMRLRRGKVA